MTKSQVRRKMSASVAHLFWGVLLFTLYLLKAAMLTPLMRTAAQLQPSQTYALMAAGEVVSFLPNVGIIKRQWSIRKRVEWITFILFGAMLSSNVICVIYCSQHMPLGGLFFRYCDIKDSHTAT